MVNRNTLLYFLFSKNGLPLYVDDNGMIQEGNQNWKRKDNANFAKLEHDPEGWKDALVKYGRNIKWWGVFRDMSVPMKFTHDGAKILRDINWRNGYEGVAHLGIVKLDREELGYNYKPWYISEINFTKYKEGLTGVTVEALEGGLSKYLKAYQTTRFEIPLSDDYEKVVITMDGMKFDQAFNYAMAETRSLEPVGEPPITFLNSEGTSFYLSGGSQPNDALLTNNGPNNIEVTLKGEIKFVPAGRPPVQRVKFRLVTGGPPSVVIQSNEVSVENGKEYTITYDKTFTLPAGGRVAIDYELVGFTTTSNERGYIEYKETSLRISCIEKYQATDVDCHTPFNLLRKLIEKMTDGKYSLKSKFLKSLDSSWLITCGDALRRLEKSVIKTSLDDFFQTFFSRFSVGFGIENNFLVVEHLSYFFSDKVIADLGEVTDAEIIVAEDLLFNSIAAGYEPNEYNDINGRLEFNSQQEWITDVKKSSNQLNLKSAYRADPFGIEILRANLDGKKTVDASSDNDTFLLNAKKQVGGKYILNRPAFDDIQGLIYPDTAFNILASPKRGIIENGAYLRSILYGLDATSIRLTSADKNKELSVTLNGQTVSEKSDIGVGSLGDRYFLPYYISFKAKPKDNVLELINSNPYGKVSFTWRKRKWYAFLMDGGSKPGNRDSQQWKVLSSTENQLNKFNDA